MLEITGNDSELLFFVRVSPGARKVSLGGSHDGALKISVREPADKGKANIAVLKLLANSLGLPKSKLEIKAGQTSRRKRICVKDPPESLPRRLQELGRA